MTRRSPPKAAATTRSRPPSCAARAPDAGKVYAIVTWGLTVDANLVVTPKKREIWNKPTEEFGARRRPWNKQAKGPAADRNAPSQQTLPADLK